MPRRVSTPVPARRCRSDLRRGPELATFVLAALFAGAASAQSTTKWMTDLHAVLEDRPLNEVVFPGTHDAATSGKIRYLKLDDYIGEPWVRTQRRDIGEQLRDGIRFLDLRVGALKDGKQVIQHTSFMVRTIETVLDDVRGFLDATTEDRKEVVILRFADFIAQKGTYTSAQWKALSQMITSKLQPYLVDHSVIGPRSTVSEALASSPKTKGGAVIVAMQAGKSWKDRAALEAMWKGSGEYWLDSAKTKPRYWYLKATSSYRTFSKTTTLDEIRQRSDKAIAAWQRDYDQTGQFFVLHLQGTPKMGFPPPPTPLDLAKSYNATTVGWVSTAWSHRKLNVIQIDYYDIRGGPFVPAVIALNKRPLATATPVGSSCQGSGTSLLTLGANGLPRVPNPAFALAMTGGPTGSAHAFVLALERLAVPLPLGGGCFVHVDPAKLIVSLPGDAARRLALGMPDDPKVLGATFSTQGVVVDAVRAAPVTSNALDLRLGM